MKAAIVVACVDKSLGRSQNKKHRFKQTENINHFLTFVRKVGLPEVNQSHRPCTLPCSCSLDWHNFIFETTDLYNKKNMPKVIYCIHVLRYVCHLRLGQEAGLINPRSHLLARLGKAEKIGNLVGQFDFSGEVHCRVVYRVNS